MAISTFLTILAVINLVSWWFVRREDWCTQALHLTFGWVVNTAWIIVGLSEKFFDRV